MWRPLLFMVEIYMCMLLQLTYYPTVCGLTSSSRIEIMIDVYDTREKSMNKVPFIYDVHDLTDLETCVENFCDSNKVFREDCFKIMDLALKKSVEQNIQYVDSLTPNAHIPHENLAYVAENLNKYRSKYMINDGNSSFFEITEVEMEAREIIFKAFMEKTSISRKNAEKEFGKDKERDFGGRIIKRICFIHSATLANEDLFTNNSDIPKTNNFILLELLELLKSEGLLSLLDNIFVLNFGKEISYLSEFAKKFSNVMFFQMSTDTSYFEIPTIRLLHNLAKNITASSNKQKHDNYVNRKSLSDQVQVLYLHTKGNSYKHTSEYFQMVNDWRRMMTYFLVSRHENCYHLLASNEFDTIGSNYRSNPRFYNGNMWWATASYLDTLPALPINSSKFGPEHWLLGTSKKVRAYVAHTSTVRDHYRELYPKSKYVLEEEKDLEVASKTEIDEVAGNNPYTCPSQISVRCIGLELKSGC